MSQTKLTTADNLAGRGDDFYSALITAHEGLCEADSHRLNARLVLILANYIADLAILRQALEEARRGLRGPHPSTHNSPEIVAAASAVPSATEPDTIPTARS